MLVDHRGEPNAADLDGILPRILALDLDEVKRDEKGLLGAGAG